MISSVVSDVAKKEGYTLERPAVELVALLAEGSFRDALGILQKVLAVSGDKTIDLEEVETVSGAPRSELIRNLLSSIAKKDVSAGLSSIQSAVAHNVDPRILTKLLIHRMRMVLLLRYAPDIAKTLSQELSEPDIVLAKELSANQGVTSDTLRALLDAYAKMAYSAVPHLPLELAIIDIGGNNKKSA